MGMAKKTFVLMIAAVMAATVLLSYITTYAASRDLIPSLKVIENPGTQYGVGDRITFRVASPNYGGAVEYRVILWNGSTKTQSELWPKMPGYYYTNWRPSGNFAFPITWIVTKDMAEGPYRLTVLTRRAGSSVSYDSYVNLPVFWVKDGSAGYSASISSIDDIKASANEGDKYSLPSKIPAKMSDGTIKNVDVSWNSTAQTDKPGSYTYEGTVNGYSKKVWLTLTVNAVPLRVESVY